MSAPADIYVTNSELGTIRQCEQRWVFAYRDLLQPRYAPRPLTVGAAVHEGIAALYRYLQQHQALGALWRWSADDTRRALNCAKLAMNAELERRQSVVNEYAQFDDGVDFGEQLAEESAAAMAEATTALVLFIDHILRHDIERYEVLDVERAFAVPVPNEQGNLRSRVTLRGRFDLVLRDRSTGKVKQVEHKTCRGYAHEQDYRLDVDPQPRAYAYALRELYGDDADPSTVLLNVVRKSAPSAPHINLDGTVSTAAIDTTRALYEAACAAQSEPDWLLAARSAVGQAEREGKVTKAVVERLQKAVKRWDRVQAKQAARAVQLPVTLDRWVYRSEYILEPAQLEQWRLDVHATVRHQLRDLLAGRRRAVRNGYACHQHTTSCAYRPICVDDGAERQSLYDLRVHRHAEALDDPLGAD